MHLISLTVEGYRGFAQEQTLRFAQPTGEIGSGLTILVGPNNGGKSSVLEALSALFSNRVTFTEGKRNSLAGDRVSLGLSLTSGVTHELCTSDRGGSTTIREPSERPQIGYYTLPSRRFFNPHFNHDVQRRAAYTANTNMPSIRSGALNRFSSRLFHMIENDDNSAEFNRVLKAVADEMPDWTIEQDDHESYYLKFDASGQSHNSDGLGEGLVSLLFCADALYDSSAGDVIAIDEPELSLHPVYQRKLARLLAEYAKDRQIVYATHSTYFADFDHILKGAEIARVHKDDGSCVVSQIRRETVEQLARMHDNLHNPHILGLNAREVFFQADGVVLLEGQEDVVYYPQVIDQLSSDFDLSDKFFGWGAGGAGNISKIAALLRDLGFKRVAAILDNNERCKISDLEAEFPGFFFGSIPANDVRTKPSREAQREVRGLLDNGLLRAEFAVATESLFDDVHNYLSQG